MNDWISLLGKPWFISDAGMETLVRFMNGAKQGPDGGSQFFGMEWDAPQTTAPRHDYDNISVIDVFGPLIKRPISTPRGFEVSSYEAVRATLEEVLDDSSVDAVILDIDSPGGTVDGCRELAEFIHSVRGVKPVAALANGGMTSAAQYIGSAADSVYAVSPMTLVGSIGVIQLHLDFSKFNEQWGINPTWLHAGSRKAAGNPDEPLSKDDKAYFQERLDQAYDIFTSDVARYLGLDMGEVSAWADGQFFRASVGQELGLVHGIKTRQELIASLKEDAMTKTAAQLRNDHPEAVQEIVSSTEKAALEKADKEKATAVTEATTKATDEALALVGVVLGDEAKAKMEPVLKADSGIAQATAIAKAMTPAQDGQDNSGNDAAADADAGDKASRQAILDGLKQADQKDVAPGGQSAPTKEEQRAAAIERMSKF
jgi:signal peptide peptidase SppA